MCEDWSGPGRSYGGTAIIWHNNMQCKVGTVNTSSRRTTNGLVCNGARQYLIIRVCIYALFHQQHQLYRCEWRCAGWNMKYLNWPIHIVMLTLWWLVIPIFLDETHSYICLMRSWLQKLYIILLSVMNLILIVTFSHGMRKEGLEMIIFKLTV